jgi:hypothetical protein
MDTRPESGGWQTFLEHWWFLPVTVVGLTSSQFLSFFMRLTGKPWIWCYAIGLFVAAAGAALIYYAKIPLYRQRRFFIWQQRVAGEQACVISLELPLCPLRCRNVVMLYCRDHDGAVSSSRRE